MAESSRRPAQIVDAILASEALRTSIVRAVEASSSNTGNVTTQIHQNGAVEEEVRSLFRPNERTTQSQRQQEHDLVVQPTASAALGQRHQSILAPSTSGISVGDSSPSTSTGIRGAYPIFQMRRNYTTQTSKRYYHVFSNDEYS